MLYQLPNGKVIHLSIDEYLDLTDLDIQYLMSIDYGDTVIDPFSGSAINGNAKEIYYDFSSLSIDDEELNNISSSDTPFDDIIDLSDNLDL
jgi:hypothetical protein